MIPKECKRLAEVDFPIAEVSKHAVREKSIHHGHPSTLHLWWARRPLASSRAMLMALLLPDPCDPYCPGDFKEKARCLLPPLCGSVGNTDYDLQRKLFHFIADFANWDNAHKKEYLELSRALIQAAHPEETPLVVDPFSGGGSIPLEALRIGCDAFASDLNPVACLILKIMLEEIPKSRTELIDDLKATGEIINNRIQEELNAFFPEEPDNSKPIAYIWARSVRCESPNCGAEIPLVRSFWLCKRANKKLALKPIITRTDNKIPKLSFMIFEPLKDSEVQGPTVARATATCLCCGSVLSSDRVKTQLSEQNGGADVIFGHEGERVGGARLLSVVLMKEGMQGKNYRLGTDEDYKPILLANQKVNQIIEEWESEGRIGHAPFPDEPTPIGGGSGAGRAFSVRKYGFNKYSNLFSNRQKLVHFTISKAINECKNKSISVFLALAQSKHTERNSSLSSWIAATQAPRGTFARQALSIIWDFLEIPYATQNNDFIQRLDDILLVIKSIKSANISQGTISQQNAESSPLSDESVDVVFTDPPYYDAIPYSDLSDFFLVWLKRTQIITEVDPYDKDNTLSPKAQEIVQDETRYSFSEVKDRDFFEKHMGLAFTESRRILINDGICSVVFANKTTEGWEALLNGIIESGLTITGSWPIATERSARLRASNSAALATSIHLVCRPRPENAGIGDWAEVLQELPDKMGKWMDRLETEGIRGADLVFSCIGPALEIFSRYDRVETAAGEEISIGRYLEKVWEVVGRIALEQILGSAESLARNGAAGALEEDARLTALFLWTLQSTDGEATPVKDKAASDSDDDDEDSQKQAKAKSGFSLVYDVARRFAQPLGIDLAKWDKRIIDIEKGSVRLIPVMERAKSLFGTKLVRAESSFDLNEQLDIFDDSALATPVKLKGRKKKQEDNEEGKAVMITTLDKVHAAMILQDMGHTNTLRALIKSEMEQGQDFQRLANSLSALYPKGSKEKRLVDAMLLSVRSVS